mmetsp:Transcript_69052/g.202158  ORF Transcript_69052/g.202158 Transcript_69052/m.202158 type:complete len:413 (-) Transcript_69052:31-1269(-)
MAVDTLAVLYSILGGIFMGSYPVPVKSDRVLQVRPHPVVFQCYKTFWVFVTGWMFLLTNGGAGFQFSWWAVLSAFCWVPSGLLVIFAAPLIGIGMAAVMAACANSALSFLVFWLLFGARLAEHGPPGREFYLAPWYLLSLLLGMAALVAVPRVRCCAAAVTASDPPVDDQLGVRGPEAAERTREADKDKHQDAHEGVFLQEAASLAENREGNALRADMTEEASRNAPEVMNATMANFAAGLCGACCAGLLSACQFGVASKARTVEESAAGCLGNPDSCPPALREQFNNFGSWMTSFGIGAAVATLFLLACFQTFARARKGSMPGLHLRALWLPGSVAGICWVLGNLFQLAAIMRGGPIVMAASNNCFQLVTSGAWGLIYYREVRGVLRVSLWILAASWTIASAVLLSGEKAA